MEIRITSIIRKFKSIIKIGKKFNSRRNLTFKWFVRKKLIIIVVNKNFRIAKFIIIVWKLINLIKLLNLYLIKRIRLQYF